MPSTRCGPASREAGSCCSQAWPAGLSPDLWGCWTPPLGSVNRGGLASRQLAGRPVVGQALKPHQDKGKMKGLGAAVVQPGWAQLEQRTEPLSPPAWQAAHQEAPSPSSPTSCY